MGQNVQVSSGEDENYKKKKKMQEPISEHSWIKRVTESLTLRLFALLSFEMYYTGLKTRYKKTYAKIITVL